MRASGQQESTRGLLSKDSREEERRHYESLSEESGESDKISKFFFKAQSNPFYLIQMCQKNRAMSSMREDYPSMKDIAELKEKFIQSTGGKGDLMSYPQYKQLKEFWPERLRRHLSSLLFILIGGPTLIAIKSDILFNHLEMLSTCVDHFLFCHMFDPNDTGYISIESLKKYLTHFASSIEQLTVDGIVDEYVAVVALKIAVTTNPLNPERVMLSELFKNKFLLGFVANTESSGLDIGFSISIDSVSEIYTKFHDIDSDGDERVAAKDLMNLRGYSFTSVFCERCVDILYPNFPRNFDWFTIFVTILESIGDTFSNSALFEVLDIDEDGFITESEVRYFYADIIPMYVSRKGENPPPAEFILDEITDLVGMKTLKIDKETFTKSKESAYIIKNLIDLNSYINQE